MRPDSSLGFQNLHIWRSELVNQEVQDVVGSGENSQEVEDMVESGKENQEVQDVVWS